MPCADFNLDTITLRDGSHGDAFDGECCLLEAANVAATCDPALRERFGAPDTFGDDHPSISRVGRALGRGLNDLTWESDDARTAALRSFVTRLLGTATTEADEETRAWMATDWLARVHAPAFLRLAGLEDHARALEALARITDAVTAEAAQPALDRAQAASAAVSDSAWDSAYAAVSGSARSAAWYSARAAVSVSARAAVSDSASAAAWDSARAAASDSASAAARAALAPTALALRASAIELLGAMCDVGRVA